MDEPIIEVADTPLEDAPGGKTPESEITLDDLPDEGDDLETPDEPPVREKPNRSETIQKIRYREKLRKAESDIEDLKKKLEASQKRTEETGLDEKEKAAQAYIRREAQRVFEELDAARKLEEARSVREFQNKIQELLEDNPEIIEKDLIDTVQELNVEPEVALKILNRDKSIEARKPRIPRPRQAPIERKTPEKQNEEDRGKDIWEIGRQIKEKMKKEFGLERKQ